VAIAHQLGGELPFARRDRARLGPLRSVA